MVKHPQRGTRPLSAVEVNEERIERLPRPLRERAWKLADTTSSVERRHNEALRLIHDALMHLASLAFADYRRLRFHEPDEAVENVLLKFDRPWLRDHLDLLRYSLSAIPREQAVLRTRNLKLAQGDCLRRAIDALEQAVACDARRVGASLDAALQQQPVPKIPVLDFLALVIDYRNGSLGHQERTNWTDLEDFYECMTPVLDTVATEFVCHPEIHRALTARPLATLTDVEVAPSGECTHRCLVDQAGRDEQRRTIVADRAVSDVWPDSRWKVEVGSRLLLEADGGDLRILAPFHDFAVALPPPAPLLLPQELDRQTAVVREVLRQTWAYSRGQRAKRSVDASAIAQKVGLESDDVRAILASLESVLESPPDTVGPPSLNALSESAALRPGLGHVLAVELGHEEFALTIADLDGRSVSGTFREGDHYQALMADPHDVMRFAASQADRTRSDAGIDQRSVFAVVVSVAACVTSNDPTDPAAAQQIAPGSGFPKTWDEFSPAAELEKALHLLVDWNPQTAVANDANLAALAESTWGAGRGSRALIYVEWSEGIGGGLVFDGELFAGAHGGAAEFGHYRGEGRAPYPCSSGHLNCLEAVASTTSMLRQANDQSGGIDGVDNFEAFWQLVRDGNHRYTHIAAVAASRVGATLAPIVAALDPDRIVIGGPFVGDATDAEILSGPVLGGIEERLPPGYRPPELRMSELGEDAVLQGAVTHGLQIYGADYLVATAKRALVEGSSQPAAH